jgi:hypothetical protein
MIDDSCSWFHALVANFHALSVSCHGRVPLKRSTREINNLKFFVSNLKHYFVIILTERKLTVWFFIQSVQYVYQVGGTNPLPCTRASAFEGAVIIPLSWLESHFWAVVDEGTAANKCAFMRYGRLSFDLSLVVVPKNSKIHDASCLCRSGLWPYW